MSKFGDLVERDVPVLIQFFAKWNDGCTKMNPVLHDVAAAMGDRILIVKIDVEKNSELVEALRIKQVPTMLLYKNHTMIWRQTEVMDANSLINVMTSLL
ncbi:MULTISPECIES: thioredoxin family protein [Myroides]|uniref:Thioredoxin n=1 Tax=Myroides albus TaxID=2562892 RepID=A0A6I3LKY1_9FLAO|nr:MULTISPECIES: thioredoxin family protein [Myroides]MTG98484.1 thioredoxin [Myroides albus]MVX34455.1 thioredoxin [Myroides sp. LoEW2-1]UVD78241.1 thioredoxin family protein [Myroides albus]